MIRVVLSMLLLLAVLGGCSGDRTVTVDNDGDRVSLAPGEEIRVTLDGNITTGFSWELVEYDPLIISPLGDATYEEDGGDTVGAGGRWTWTLQAVAAGETPVRFVYHRTWEEDPPAQTFSFTAVVGQ